MRRFSGPAQEPAAAYDYCSMAFHRISHDPAVMGGKPCIRGLRITVGTIVGLIASGSSHEWKSKKRRWS
jgi:uncharacterized protein (DUF433 family)